MRVVYVVVARRDFAVRLACFTFHPSRGFMDPLSQVLRSLRLRGSFYAAWDLGAPWGLSFRRARFAPFHYVESGEMWLVTAAGDRVHLAAGDVVVLFDGGGHRIVDEPGHRAEPIEKIVARHRHASVMRHGGNGRESRLVCGKFLLDEREGESAVLQQLPPLVHIRRGRSAQLRAFSATLGLLAEEVRGGQPGGERAAVLLTETLFIHVLRVALTDGEPGAAGWLEALRDPQIGAALAAIHGEPERPWTVATLSRRAGLSRSVFAERFHLRLGVPPMTYLARWRLQLAARWLRETRSSVSEILDRLGYASPATFHRAFKREHGVAPTAYRRREALSARDRERARPRGRD
jgi:AraC-like DNA-binding protein